jgi:hypothetical protein
MFRRTISRSALTLFAGIALLATTSIACADTRSDRASRIDANSAPVVYMNVGQSRIIIPDYRSIEQPYALRGSAEDRSDASTRLGERIYVGQGSVTFPAAR